MFASPLCSESDVPAPQSENETFERQLGDMISNSPLEQLVTRHKELSTDVGMLESDLQTLIYENYSKFIVATDMVRSIGKVVGDLQLKFNDLEALIGGVVSQSEAVNGKLETRQDTILELTETRSLLQRLQAVLDIPMKINAAMAQESYDVAAECIVEIAPVLRRHGHRKALRPVADEVKSKRTEIVNKLQQNMEARPDCAADSLSLLLRLGESAEKLQGEYLQRERTILQAALTQASETSTSKCQESLASLEKLDTSIIEQIKAAEELFSQVFDDRSNLVQEIREWVHLWMITVQKLLQTLGDGKVRSATGLDDKESTSRFAEFGYDWGTQDIVRGLEKIRTDTLPLETRFVELAIGDKVSQLVGDVARYHIKHSFDAFEARLIIESCRLGSQVNGSQGNSAVEARVQANQGLEVLKNAALSGIQTLMDGMRPLATNVLVLMDGWQEIVALLLQSQTAQFFQTLPHRLVRLAKLSEHDPEDGQQWKFATRAAGEGFSIPALLDKDVSQMMTDQSCSPMQLVTLSVLCSFIKQTLANKATDILTSSFQTESTFVLDTNSVEECTAQLFTAYTNLMSDRLSQVVLTSADEAWSTYPDPQAPRNACLPFLEILKDINMDLQAFETPSSGGEAEKPWHSHSHQHSASSASIESVSKATNPPLSKVFTLPWTNRMQVTSSLASGALKRFVEALKGYDFSKGGFQQIQIDCQFYRTSLRKLFHGGFAEKVFATLEEIVLVAAERCAEPVLLEPSVLDKRAMANISTARHS